MVSDETIQDMQVLLATLKEHVRSNTQRLDNHEADLKENNTLISAIKELAVEMKYMREGLNNALQRLDRLEKKDAEKWDKFKWAILVALIGVIIAFLAVAVGLK